MVTAPDDDDARLHKNGLHTRAHTHTHTRTHTHDARLPAALACAIRRSLKPAGGMLVSPPGSGYTEAPQYRRGYTFASAGQRGQNKMTCTRASAPSTFYRRDPCRRQETAVASRILIAGLVSSLLQWQVSRRLVGQVLQVYRGQCQQIRT